MLSDAGFNFVLRGEGLSTGIAFELLDSQVHFEVKLVLRARGKMLIVKVTPAWLPSWVNSPVFVQATGHGE